MRLLIVTQKIDRTDPILGFFTRWVEVFAKHCDGITVLCQYLDRDSLRDLPAAVYSLGKEKGDTKYSQVFTFWRRIWFLRSQYDAVLVHMTPIWVVLGAPFWFLLRKKVYLWYEARGGGIWLQLARFVVRGIFNASDCGCPFSSSKRHTVGHGIDTDRFSFGLEDREKGLIISVGRYTRAKKLDEIVRIFASLPEASRLQLVGSAITDADMQYISEVKELASSLGVLDRIIFGSCTQEELVPLLHKAHLFLHASDTGLDKAVLEAMSCGCLVVSSGRCFQDLLPELYRCPLEELSEKAKHLLSLDSEERLTQGKELREIIEMQHGLSRLLGQLCVHISQRDHPHQR